jgi:hypothetical protein
MGRKIGIICNDGISIMERSEPVIICYREMSGILIFGCCFSFGIFGSGNSLSGNHFSGIRINDTRWTRFARPGGREKNA